MSSVNPFAQSGWQNPHSEFQELSYGAPIPSIHGALPNLSNNSQTSEQLLSFRIAPLSPLGTILNSTVAGPEGRMRFAISTTAPKAGSDAASMTPGITSIKDEEGNLAATVEWHLHPIVQLHTLANTVPRQFASQFLPLSQVKSTRAMAVKGKTYQWSRDGERDCVYLHNMSYAPPEFLGFLTRASGNAVVLNVLPSGVSGGLLDVAVLSAVLLYSNRNID